MKGRPQYKGKKKKTHAERTHRFRNTQKGNSFNLFIVILILIQLTCLRKNKEPNANELLINIIRNLLLKVPKGSEAHVCKKRVHRIGSEQ